MHPLRGPVPLHLRARRPPSLPKAATTPVLHPPANPQRRLRLLVHRNGPWRPHNGLWLPHNGRVPLHQAGLQLVVAVVAPNWWAVPKAVKAVATARLPHRVAHP
jgi:hypothetical protein